MRELIDQLLQMDPFHSFRIILSSGHQYEVQNPGMLVMLQDVALFLVPRSDAYSYLRLVQIAAVDILQASA